METRSSQAVPLAWDEAIWGGILELGQFLFESVTEAILTVRRMCITYVII